MAVLIIANMLALASISTSAALPAPQEYQTTITIDGTPVPWPPITLSADASSSMPIVNNLDNNIGMVVDNTYTETTSTFSTIIAIQREPMTVVQAAPSSVVQAVPSGPVSSDTAPGNGDRSGKLVFTPHVQFLSAVGIIGCKINPDRAAYVSFHPGCNNMCMKVWKSDQTEDAAMELLHLDGPNGANDISMDAYKTLLHGPDWKTTNPGQEGSFEANYKFVPLDKCPKLLPTGKLPILAKNYEFATGCARRDLVEYWDFDDTLCQKGINQKCEVNQTTLLMMCNGFQAGHWGSPPIVAPNVTDVEPVIWVNASGNAVDV